MADNRKYYYLKLKENYFDDDSIVLLESMNRIRLNGEFSGSPFLRFGAHFRNKWSASDKPAHLSG